MPNLIERLRDNANLGLADADWVKLRNYHIPDLVFGSGIRVVLILESPDIKEVRRGFPLAGKSGEDVLKKLCEWELLRRHVAEGDSIGRLLYRGDVRWLGVMNVSRLPLQSKAYRVEDRGEEIELLLRRFSKVRRVKPNRALPCRRCTHTQSIQEVIVCDLIARLRQILHRFASPPLIVPCGHFAKVLLNAARLVGNVEVNSEISGIPEPGFIPHPSYRQWMTCGRWRNNRFGDALEHLRSEIGNRLS